MLAALLLPGQLPAQVLVVNRTLPAQTVIGPQDVSLQDGDVPGAHRAVEDAVGLETRVTLYPGRPVRLGDLGPAAVVERNEIVTLRFRSGALVIETAGRALDRAALDRGVRVMNLGSRTTVTGTARGPGLVEVGR
ncbi:flagellar basal body P-ring formation protein FlgA [Rhodobacteraceae bacterium 2CG4]|uniref:Flagella basal body P-ring formation protein FlgA n=2 Tax=Halovulum marinum TaxID=2662447 RepID=A0A6L5Z5F9_9RHOB|nr:flagellar basal body P-ring formation protein FlgA [Halovulum marinum]